MLERLFKKLNTPQKVQDYLDRMPFNFERKEETYRSPLGVVKAGEMHCFEGALFATACLAFNGYKVFLLDLKTNDLKNDADHVVVLFKQGSKWGAISKTNHAVLRWRDPIYPSVEALSFSYFHEYFLDDGTKTLIKYSAPFDIIKRFGTGWIEAEEDLDKIALALDRSKHYSFYSSSERKYIRKASKLETVAAALEQFTPNKKSKKIYGRNRK